MIKPPKKIWLTRPLDDSEHLAHDLERHGIASLIAPVKTIIRQPFSKPAELPDALLITSRHAAYALAELPPEWRALPIYCVGKATAEYVRDYGCTSILPGSSDVLALLPRIAMEVNRGGHLVYLAGEDRRIDVPAAMAAREVNVTTLIVYRAAPETALSPTLVDALRAHHIAAVAFFSPKSAEVTVELLKRYALESYAHDIEAFCLSLNVAKSATPLAWKAVHACHYPTRDAMIDLIVSKMSQT